jgi:hypothetical protein
MFDRKYKHVSVVVTRKRRRASLAAAVHDIVVSIETTLARLGQTSRSAAAVQDDFGLYALSGRLLERKGQKLFAYVRINWFWGRGIGGIENGKKKHQQPKACASVYKGMQGSTSVLGRGENGKVCKAMQSYFIFLKINGPKRYARNICLFSAAH